MKNVPPSVRVALKKRGADSILNQEGDYYDFKPQIDAIIHKDEDMSGYMGDMEPMDIEDMEDDLSPAEKKANDRIEELGSKFRGPDTDDSGLLNTDKINYNVRIKNSDSPEEYKRKYGEDAPKNYPFGWTTKEQWDNFRKQDPQGMWMEWDDLVENTKEDEKEAIMASGEYDDLSDVENGASIAYGKAGVEAINDAKRRNYYLEHEIEDAGGQDRYHLIIDKNRNYDGSPKNKKLDGWDTTKMASGWLYEKDGNRIMEEWAPDFDKKQYRVGNKTYNSLDEAIDSFDDDAKAAYDRGEISRGELDDIDARPNETKFRDLNLSDSEMWNMAYKYIGEDELEKLAEQLDLESPQDIPTNELLKYMSDSDIEDMMISNGLDDYFGEEDEDSDEDENLSPMEKSLFNYKPEPLTDEQKELVKNHFRKENEAKSESKYNKLEKQSNDPYDYSDNLNPDEANADKELVNKTLRESLKLPGDVVEDLKLTDEQLKILSNWFKTPRR